MKTIILLLMLQTAQPTAQPLRAANPERCEMHVKQLQREIEHTADPAKLKVLNRQLDTDTAPIQAKAIAKVQAPSDAPFVGSVSAITSDNVFPAFILADSINTPMLATCTGSDDLTVKDCKIVGGHTLDEVINYLLKSQRRQYDSDQAETKAILDAWDKSLLDIEEHLTPKLVMPQVKQDDVDQLRQQNAELRRQIHALKHPRRVYSCKRHPENCKR